MPKYDFYVPHEFEDKNRKVRWNIRVRVQAVDAYEARKMAMPMLIAAEERILGGYEDGSEGIPASLPDGGSEEGTRAAEADGQSDVRGSGCSFLGGSVCRLYAQVRREVNPVF